MTDGSDRPRALERLLGGVSDDASGEFDQLSDARLVGDVLRRIRIHRRMGVGEIAKALDMPRRSYENLEAGRGRVSYDRIERFARAVDADPVAILATTVFRTPDAALHAVDNKLFLIAFVAAAELLEELGADVDQLDTRTIITAYDQVTRGLIDAARHRDTFAEDWLGRRAKGLGMSLSELFGRKRRP